MLIKEYRIPLPLTVEEYRIAQLYMIAKKSRDESSGAGSGVEILINEPYAEGPGGQGQYTRKVYHVGSHLPGWFKGLLPKSALTVEEEAWNAYPYTKTRYTCPFVEKFSLEIETYYHADNGHRDNVFGLSSADYRNRVVDVIDVVKDQLYGADYVREEDPKIYISEKTNRGPLTDNWLEVYWNAVKDRPQPTPDGMALMCAYKLCRVEFRYWGMQTKLEKFIHDVALRKTMLRAHRQAWAWQDEWHGLTMDDIRQIERQTQLALRNKMSGAGGDEQDDTDASPTRGCEGSSNEASQDATRAGAAPTVGADKNQSLAAKLGSIEKSAQEHQHAADGDDRSCADSDEEMLSENWRPPSSASSTNKHQQNIINNATISSAASTRGGGGSASHRSHHHSHRSHHPGPPPLSPAGSACSFDMQVANWRLGALAVRQEDSDDEDCDGDNGRGGGGGGEEEDDEEEFFDCQGEMSADGSLAKWSSLELLTEEDQDGSPLTAGSNDDSIFNPAYMQRASRSSTQAVQGGLRSRHGVGGNEPPQPLTFSHHYQQQQPFYCPPSPSPSPSRSNPMSATSNCPTTVLVMVLHAGSVLDASVDATARKSDVTTFRGAFESVVRQHYPALLGRVAVRLVSCPCVCCDALSVLSSLSPYSFDVSPIGLTAERDWSTAGGGGGTHVTHDTIPIGSLPLLATNSPDYPDAVNRTIAAANNVYNEFLKSEDGVGFCGQVCMVGDSVGSILGFDALCRVSQRHDSENSVLDTDIPVCVDGNVENECDAQRLLQAPCSRRRSSSISEASGPCSSKLEFDVSDFFMFGSPLALVLAARRISEEKNSFIPRPQCTQVYNLFHPTDPVAVRLEPLLSARFSVLPPVNVARYAKYPLGNGQPYHLLELIQSNPQIFAECPLLGGGGGSYGIQTRRMSDISIQSTISGVMDNIPLQTINALQQKWWGTKRLDYALYCPEGLANFPTNALPHLFHASYWESFDVIAFILRQVGRLEPSTLSGYYYDDYALQQQALYYPPNSATAGGMGSSVNQTSGFRPSGPREKWSRKRTSVKLKNVAANHRANDAIAREGAAQVLSARFAYGPLDVIALAGEKVDVHVSDCTSTASTGTTGEWTCLGTVVTDKAGRATFEIPAEKALGYGLHPVKMVVRGDHTCVDFYLAVVPPLTECVVFSVDGSFTASVSVTGRDPKVRAGAVDIVRHWQELGYLIIYITGRPDMQHRRVVSWLAQHNFPHGLVSFADGLSTDPLGHKAAYLNNLIQNHGMLIHQAYGSAKDITMYTNIGLKPKQIFIVGKVSKKHHSQATVLSDGYAAHLAALSAHGGSRPAQGNARMVLPRGHFGLPGQSSAAAASLRRRSVDSGAVMTSPSRNCGNNKHHDKMNKVANLINRV